MKCYHNQQKMKLEDSIKQNKADTEKTNTEGSHSYVEVKRAGLNGYVNYVDLIVP